MRRIAGNKFVRMGIVAALVGICAAGCSSVNDMTGGVTSSGARWAPPLSSSGSESIAKMPKDGSMPPPAVQDCALVASSTPSRYACNGKTYTSYELAKMRMDWDKKYASGK